MPSISSFARCIKHGTNIVCQVRHEFPDMLSAWLLELPDRDEHRPCLLPYPLSSTVKEASHMRLFTFQLTKQRRSMRACWQVRRAFLDMLATWLLELPDRDEHRPRLLPYLLAALADPAPTLAAAAAAALEALGAQYEREHAAELKACH